MRIKSPVRNIKTVHEAKYFTGLLALSVLWYRIADEVVSYQIPLMNLNDIGN